MSVSFFVFPSGKEFGTGKIAIVAVDVISEDLQLIVRETVFIHLPEFLSFLNCDKFRLINLKFF